MRYPTFDTICHKCYKKLRIQRFNIQVGMLNFALCPKHEKELRGYLKKWIGKKWEGE